MTRELLNEKNVQTVSDSLKEHIETLFSGHADRIERNLKNQIKTLQDQLETHEHKRHASHLKFCLTMAAALAVSAFVHFRHHKAQ
ncbi:hypothetical protein CSR02_04430 [Acetobacter pomorum]|uniref:Uncharacterized protein n=1 Tax=Acetobacter pomorum TaxID=65959 RepID=A0A2G4RE22_9PROT|nr:hypothetical protein AZ09_07070 [Acetobacter aceti 1023]PHY94839.1 hypothetical protein CSR02_04430 [Acetobacter pomorum]